jgi:roadblock/LC7 domain-containing protein
VNVSVCVQGCVGVFVDDGEAVQNKI